MTPAPPARGNSRGQMTTDHPARMKYAGPGASRRFRRLSGSLQTLPTPIWEPPDASDDHPGASRRFRRLSGSLQTLQLPIREPPDASDAYLRAFGRFRRLSGSLQTLQTPIWEPPDAYASWHSFFDSCDVGRVALSNGNFTDVSMVAARILHAPRPPSHSQGIV